MGQMMRDNRTRKMDAAKEAIKTVLQTVPASTQIGLLTFSARDSRQDWVYPLGPRNDAALLTALAPIQPGAGTPLGAYIKKGADRLLQERSTQYGYGTYRLLIVTDGEAQDKDLVERYTPEAMARGITMDVIGVAMNSAHTLATKVHSYRRADDPASLRRAIQEVFAEVGGAATDVAQADAFEMLAPIPVGVASAMIQALVSSGNEPLGNRPAARPAQRPAATPSPAPAARPPAAPPPRAPVHSDSRGTSFMSIVVGLAIGALVLVFGFIVVLALVIKTVRRRNR